MRRLLLVALGIGLALPAQADMYQDASNAQLPEAMVKLLSGGALIGPVHLGYPGASPRIYAYGNSYGATSGGGIFGPYIFNTNSDTVDCSSAVGCYGTYFGHNFGGATDKGNRTGSFTLLNLTEPTGNAGGPTMWYTATGAESRASAADGGTPGTPRGDVFAGNFIATLTGTSANMNALVGVEIDVSAGGLGPVAYKSGLSIIQQTTDVHQATVDDAAFLIANQGGGSPPGWRNGIAFGAHSGWWPMAAAGTMIGTIAPFPGGPAYAAANGVDFSQVSFSGAAFKSKAFAASDNGEVTLGRTTAAASAPGAANGRLRFVCGTTAGTAKLVAYAGTSATPVTITDNIGAGVSGC